MACVSHWQEQSHRFLCQPQQPYTKGQRTPSESHHGAPGFCGRAEENVSQPGTAETGGLWRQTGLARAEQGVPRRRFSRGSSVQTTGNAGREDRCLGRVPVGDSLPTSAQPPLEKNVTPNSEKHVHRLLS